MSQTRITSDPDTDHIVQFTSTERNALKWADDECWDLNTESTHGFNRVLSKLSGPHKSVPFRFESYGAMIRGIEVPLLKGQEWKPWRQKLVDFILSYRQHFRNAYTTGAAFVICPLERIALGSRELDDFVRVVVCGDARLASHNFW